MTLTFDNRFHQLGNHFYSEMDPVPLVSPELIVIDEDVAALLGLDASITKTSQFLQMASGQTLWSGMQPLAQDYAGHQLGKFNPFLGDGRALLLGEVETRQGRFDLCLKGAGKTPYSRAADGRAGMTECLHEFEMSRRLQDLAIPTSRVLCVVGGDELVYRGGFQRSAMLLRVARTHVRIGTFENYYFQKNPEAIRKLMDYVIRTQFSELEDAGDERALLWFSEVVKRSARLIAHWQAKGFVHGMMNTDNHSIVGETLDLGWGCFNPGRDDSLVACPQDERGRYAYGEQPLVGLWNLNVLAKSLSPIIESKVLRAGLSHYEPEYLVAFESLSQT